MSTVMVTPSQKVMAITQVKTRMKAELKNLAEKQADIYKVFGNATRLRILWALADRELSVSEIAAAAGTSLQNTSQHLHLMQDKGILTSRRESQTIFYRITDNEMMQRYLPFVQTVLPEGIRED
jgi:DNA-binding transcriptional ArsR family regulator